jgi:hypothetical protein
MILAGFPFYNFVVLGYFKTFDCGFVSFYLRHIHSNIEYKFYGPSPPAGGLPAIKFIFNTLYFRKVLKTFFVYPACREKGFQRF